MLRSSSDRITIKSGGVISGICNSLGWSHTATWIWRIVFLLVGSWHPIGWIIYGFLWLTMPLGS